MAGVQSLSIRNVEHWRYEVGGHLDNDTHFDGGSIVTIVCALNGGYGGGVFRTFAWHARIHGSAGHDGSA